MLRFLLLALLLVAWPALAVEPDEILDDPALEARARAISTGLRCVQCQNQTIDESNAPLARDLRLIVRERLEAGDSDEEVISHVRARYGDFVLMKPPVNQETILLWVGPFLALVAAGGILLWRMRQTPPLDDEDPDAIEEVDAPRATGDRA
ncbi:MAG: cytochrome c-type biogenesis protein [Thermaurantiacus sp.]